MSRRTLDRWLRTLAGDDSDARQQAAMQIMELYAQPSGEDESAPPAGDAFSDLLKQTLTTHGFPATTIVRRLFERYVGAQQEHQERCGQAKETGDYVSVLDDGPFFNDGGFNMEWPVILMVLERCGQAARPLMPQLRELLDSSDVATRNVAAKMIEGLEASGEDALDDLFEALYRRLGTYWPDPRARAIAEHAKHDEAVLDRVIAGLDSDDQTVRQASCTVLTAVGPAAARAVPKLLELADNADDPALVVSALGELGDNDEKVVSVLLRTLDDERNWIRSSAISALGGLRAAPDLVVPALAGFLESWRPPWEDRKVEFDPDFDDFDDAIEVLGGYRQRAAAALPVLERLLERQRQEDDYETREQRFQLEVAIARIRGEKPPDP